MNEQNYGARNPRHDESSSLTVYATRKFGDQLTRETTLSVAKDLRNSFEWNPSIGEWLFQIYFFKCLKSQ